ncbi:hypothetical protein [Rhizobium leguminosarum]|uniref:hypothetical protein n=1 Tax=Rhizobium leguminosarum TaxID=384 RepID=UPI0010327B09|nr:hypothetical protein [Rhizobium leguminosarum]TBG66572.1 hypothetical protein ELG74_01150 [Rhizobium leguminosarum]
MIFRIFFPLIFFAFAASVALADSVYWNYGIASVQVGFDKDRNRPVGNKISFVGLGPDNISSRFENCIKNGTIAAGESTWIPLDNHILDATQVVESMVASKELINTETLKARFKDETDKTETLIAHAEQVYRRTIAKCMGGNEEAARSVQLGIVSRICVTWAPAGNPCQEARSPVGRMKDPATGRYAKIYDWLEPTGALRPLNQIVQLVGKGGRVGDIAPDLRDRAYIPAPSEEVAQRVFEDGAERFRRIGLRYDYIAPRVATIDKSVAIALIDVMDHPAFVFDKLKDAHKRLLSASNEVARTRLKECLLYQGKPDILTAALCAGVKGEVQALEACIEGGRCVPDMAAEAARAALTYTSSFSIKDLALNSQLPRILGDGSFEQYKNAARACAEINSNTQDFSFCVLRSQLKGADAVVLQCIRNNGAEAAAKCVAENMPNSAGARAARCFLEAQDDRAKALCLASEIVPDAARAYQCYVDNAGDKSAALACVAAENLSPEAKTVISCATQSRKDYKAVGACLVSKNLSGDAQRLVNCYASSNGSWVGAGICLAGGSLSAEQQILLQCATQTGGEPVSFAACTGGLLALKEFQQCQDNSFGEDDCFGENNEIRKFVKNVGLGDIDRNTVVGQIANAHLDALKSTVSVTESIIGGVGRVADDIGRELGRIPGALAGLPDGVREEACKVLGDVCPDWDLDINPFNSAVQNNLDPDMFHFPIANEVSVNQAKERILRWQPWILKPQEPSVLFRPCDEGNFNRDEIAAILALQPCGDRSTTASNDILTTDNTDKNEALHNQDMKSVWSMLDTKDPSAMGDVQISTRRAKAIYEASSDGAVQFGDRRVAIPVRLKELSTMRLKLIGIRN